jgi:F-type H+-transporting ATPase subunit gamma
MAQIKDLKDRIKGVKSTQKITKAMKSMALIRLQKIEAKALASRPHVYAITDLVSHLDSDSFYFTGNKSNKTLFVIFTSDRGLCGAFNDSLLRESEKLIAAKEKEGGCKLILVGTKAVVHFARKKQDVVSRYSHLPADPTVSLSNLVMDDCRKQFRDGQVGEVVLVYNNLKSRLRYELKIKKMLPLPRSAAYSGSGTRPIFIYEPDKESVVNALIENFLESNVFHSFLDLYASEYSARLVAMTKATDSADDMIQSLTLELNKTRQAAITTEILEVISGAEALTI